IAEEIKIDGGTMAESQRNGGPAIQDISQCAKQGELGPEGLLFNRQDCEVRRKCGHDPILSCIKKTAHAKRRMGKGGGLVPNATRPKRTCQNAHARPLNHPGSAWYMT